MKQKNSRIKQYKKKLDDMNNSSYNLIKTEWETKTTEEYDTWFLEQDEDSQASIRMKVDMLIAYGPHLPRPHSDTLNGSKLKNLKELRTHTEHHVFRIAYIFDKERKALLLIGGDKKGKDEKLFYRNLIKQAEKIYKNYSK